jgi:hypothetical protein
MLISSQKSEIINWINSVEDPNIINQIDIYRKQHSIDFESLKKNAISGDELKVLTSKHIDSLEWKK